jgi:hypothetical protein
VVTITVVTIIMISVVVDDITIVPHHQYCQQSVCSFPSPVAIITTILIILTLIITMATRIFIILPFITFTIIPPFSA